MPKVGRYQNPTINVDWHPDTLPEGCEVQPIVLPTPDRASTSGNLYFPAGGPRAVVAIMHPRVDLSHHYLIPGLLRAGYGVWAQRSRWVGNDLNLVHERVLIDIAVAHNHLESNGFDDIYLLGNSGGASLYAFYMQQAGYPPDGRLTEEPSGAPVDLTIDMPSPSGLVLLAPHPGQGDLLLHSIDPSVVDEHDAASVDPSVDMYDPDNGFEEPPAPSSYSDDFLRRYRQSQRERVRRIDARARDLIASTRALRQAAKDTGSTDIYRKRLTPDFMVVYRTDADPRTTDLELDPSERDYGSIFGVRPDITNFGPVGFGRLTTPRAWLSTWSALSSQAALRLTGPDIAVPTLLIYYTADNSVFPSDIEAIRDSIASDDLTYEEVLGDHYGYEPGTQNRSAGAIALEAIVRWLNERTA